MRVLILTVSDSVASGNFADKSGPALAERCAALGWEVVGGDRLADEREAIAGYLKTAADDSWADLILTTGGTGVGPRDVTPEATLAIAERNIPGFAEQMRFAGLKQTPRAILSRAVTVIRRRSIIINLPGSPAGAVASLDAIAALLPHAIDVLHGAHHG
jgi:molybdopterin adenylyltransferase